MGKAANGLGFLGDAKLPQAATQEENESYINEDKSYRYLISRCFHE
jgi:hypothetical protein